MTETPVLPPMPAIKGLHQAFLDQIAEDANNANAARSALDAAEGNDASLAESILASADTNSPLGKAQAKISDLEAKVAELLAHRDSVLAEAVATAKAEQGTVDVEALTTLYKKSADEAKTNTRLLKSVLVKAYGEEATDRILGTLPQIVGAKRASGSAGSVGGTRIRGFAFYVDGSDTPVTMEVAGKDEQGNSIKIPRSNVAAVAALLDTEQEIVKEAMYAMAGTRVNSDIPDTVTFTVLDGENKSRDVVAKRDKVQAPVTVANGASVTVAAE